MTSNNPINNFVRLVIVAALLPLAGPGRLSSAEAPRRADPLRTFQFVYQKDSLDEAVLDYLTFVKKVSPGVREIGSQYVVADLLMDRGNFKESARLLKRLAETPGIGDFFRCSVLMRLGMCHMRLGNYAEASGYYEAVANGPVEGLVPEGMIGLSLARMSAGDTEVAYQKFREVIALYPSYRTHPRYMLPLGLIQWQARKYAAALQSLLMDDRNPVSLYFSGLCYRELKRFPEACGLFRRISQEYPASPWADRARFELGETFYSQGDFLLAAHTFDDIVQAHRSPGWDQLASFRTACCEIRLKKFAEAERRLASLSSKKLDPLLVNHVQYLLTEALAQQDKYSAIARLSRHGGRGKRPQENAYRLIWATASQGRYQKAIDLARSFLSKGNDPELVPRTLFLQGYVYELMGKRAEAFATYQLVAEHFSKTPYAARAVELSAINFFKAGEFKLISTQVGALWRRVDPDVQKAFPESLYWMGLGAMKLRDFGLAQKFFKDFVSMAPPTHRWFSEGLRAQALAFASDKSLKEALPILQRTIQSAQASGNVRLMSTLTLDIANLLFNSGQRYEDAAGYYRRLETIDPKDDRVPFALFQAALCLYRTEYYIDAADVWAKIPALYPRDPRAAEALFRSVRTKFEMGRYLDAVEGYRLLVRDFPKSEFVRDARFQIGQAYFNAKDWPKAIESYMEFKTLYPSDAELPQVNNYIQLASYNSGMSVKEMEEKFRGQIKTPVLADFYWQEGVKLYNQNRYAEARDNFQKISLEFPNSSWAPQASFYRADTLFLEENYRDAAAAYESFLQGFPSNANAAPAQFRLGVCYFNLNDFDRSAAVFGEFLAAFPSNALAKNAAMNVAISYARMGDVEKTTQAYLVYGDKFPDAEDVGAAYVQLGQFLEKVGQETRALEAYRRVSSKRPEYPQSLYLLARLHKGLSEPAGEKQAYLALAKIPAKSDPYRIAGLLALADIHLSAGEVEPALALYEDVEKNASDEPSRSLAIRQRKDIRKALEGAAGR